MSTIDTRAGRVEYSVIYRHPAHANSFGEALLLNIQARFAAGLKRAGVETLEQIADADRKRLLKISGLGQGTIDSAKRRVEVVREGLADIVEAGSTGIAAIKLKAGAFKFEDEVKKVECRPLDEIIADLNKNGSRVGGNIPLTDLTLYGRREDQSFLGEWFEMLQGLNSRERALWHRSINTLRGVSSVQEVRDLGVEGLIRPNYKEVMATVLYGSLEKNPSQL